MNLYTRVPSRVRGAKGLQAKTSGVEASDRLQVLAPDVSMLSIGSVARAKGHRTVITGSFYTVCVRPSCSVSRPRGESCDLCDVMSFRDGSFPPPGTGRDAMTRSREFCGMKS